MTNLARKRAKLHRSLWRRWTGEGIFMSHLFQKVCLSWCVIFVQLRILPRFLHEHSQKYLAQPCENRRIHPTIEWPLIIPLSRTCPAILCVSQHEQIIWLPSSMNPLCSRSTQWGVSRHQGCELFSLVLDELEINEVSIHLCLRNEWFSIGKFWF